MLLLAVSEYVKIEEHTGYPGFITTITSASTSLNYHWEVTWHMTLFCFFWHRFRGHGADSPLTMFTFTWHLSLSHRRRWKPAHAHCGWGSNSLPPATMFKITGHCLHCYTGLAGSRTVLSELRTQLPTVQCTVQYSVQVYSAVYYWCTVDTWSLLHCTGMRSPHYGFVCKHRQGLLCMFSWKDRKEGLGLEFQFCHRYRDDYTTSGECLHLLHYFQKLSKHYWMGVLTN